MFLESSCDERVTAASRLDFAAVEYSERKAAVPARSLGNKSVSLSGRKRTERLQLQT